MSEKVCSHHKSKKRKILQRCCAVTLILLFLILLIILIIGAILHPEKPRFILQDVTVFVLNVSAPNLVSTTIQITILSRNPNSHIGIYYDALNVYANYNRQVITLRTAIPPTYQGHKDINVWSPFVFGINTPIAPFNGQMLLRDQINCLVRMTFRIDGRVKWKVGSYITDRYHIHVSCTADIPLGDSGTAGLLVPNRNAVKKYQLLRSCRVSL